MANYCRAVIKSLRGTAIIQNIGVTYFILSAILLESLQSAKLKITSCIPSFLESAEEKYCRDWLQFSQH
jgi:hypothetical protein